jgi:hypothetical protein
MPSTILPDSDTKPFKIDISNEAIEVLEKKLALATLPDELEGAGRDYGVPLADVQRLLSRWKDGYDWRKYEKQLNDELPQFQKHIDVVGFDSLNVHYVHKKSEVEGAIPLLFVHGCECLGLKTDSDVSLFNPFSNAGPGSFYEVRKILPLLTQGATDEVSFHVVALSLPGYGFSDGPKRKGFAIDQYAEVRSCFTHLGLIQRIFPMHR